ncbi:MAG: energy-coupling factor transporter transmembrane protein EcfT [Thermomicrobiales bacterium]|nr:energy-coupling factor transporter transmembrane protein EcfT [Thermomicrobiales bacterium]
MSAASRADTRSAGKINPAAWLAWFGAAALTPVVSRNPLYLALALLVVLTVYLSIPHEGSLARAWRLVVVIGTTLSLFSVGFNLLTVHIGDRVIMELPSRLPIIGGALTWNAFVYGVTSALAIATLLISAATLSAAVRQADLIRLLPSRVATLGIAGTVALTLIPQTIAAAREIYDAQRARGHRFRGLRDAPSLLTPLLAAGLERSLVLAEALETRGFGASRVAQPSPRRRWPLVAASAAVVLALALIGTGRVLPGVGMIVIAIFASLAGVGGQQPRSRFRPLVWDIASVAVCAVAGLVVVTLAVSLARGLLTFSPFPRLTTPPFDPLVGGAILLLLLPVVWSNR